MQSILWFWTDIIGGKLSFSRNPKSGQPCGPMVRFLLAAAGPVMNAATPSLESLRDIVSRQKAFYRWLDKCVAEFPSMAGRGDPRSFGDETTNYDGLSRARVAASRLLRSEGIPDICEIFVECISAQQRFRQPEAGEEPGDVPA